MSQNNILSYPGVTAEVIPSIDHQTGSFTPSVSAYEAVLNCGGFSVMPTTLSAEIASRSAMHLREQHNMRAIGYITDQNILNHPNFGVVEKVFQKFFGKNIHTFGTTLQTQQNNAFGLRVNTTQIQDQDAIIQFVRDHGDDGAIFASIPMSDPSVSGVFQQLSTSEEDTVAAKTLRNLLLNQDRSNPTKIAEDANGFLQSCQTSEDVDKLFEACQDAILVFKSVQGSAGGTNTFIVSPHQRAEFMKKREQIAFPLLAYSFIKPFLISDDQGESYSAHIRPFVVGGELMGGVVKYPNKPLPPGIFSPDGSVNIEVFRKRKIEEVNRLLNSSSGLTQSLIFTQSGVFQGGFDGKKGFVSLEDIRGLRILETKDLLLDRVEEILNSTTPLVQTIQDRVNRQLQLS